MFAGKQPQNYNIIIHKHISVWVVGSLTYTVDTLVFLCRTEVKLPICLLFVHRNVFFFFPVHSINITIIIMLMFLHQLPFPAGICLQSPLSIRPAPSPMDFCNLLSLWTDHIKVPTVPSWLRRGRRKRRWWGIICWLGGDIYDQQRPETLLSWCWGK